MSLSSIIRLTIFTGLSALLFSCETQKEDFQTEALKDYLPLINGKYITYRVDSTVFTNFGRTTEIHRYQEKHVVDAQVTDNLGRPAYRVFRYINDSTASGAWVPSGSYMVVPQDLQYEVIEDNLRVIKLHSPIKQDFSWKGNSFLANNPYDAMYNFSNDDNMEDWDFYYDNLGGSESYRGNNYTDVTTVEEADESYNVPIVDVNAYAARSRSVEKYSKTIGLVFRQFELWEYQPNTGGSGGPYKTGFGVTMWMVGHN
ncbi:MAG: hypothetical protein IPP73_00115 [Chitinophagaceae bacterium]|nr:hypothetical protein [Chitinophagaceae bacterium]